MGHAKKRLTQNTEGNGSEIWEKWQEVGGEFWRDFLGIYLRIGKTKILKNPVPESEPTPLGFQREALTNKRHRRTRSVRLMFPDS